MIILEIPNKPHKSIPEQPAPSTTEPSVVSEPERRSRWWRSIGPALITACVVLGPGSLLVSSNIGAKYGCELLWLLVITGVLMATYVIIAARISVVSGKTPCSLVAQIVGRPVAAIIGINLCLVCSIFQFANNLAVGAAVETLFPKVPVLWLLLALNGLIIIFLFTTTRIYHTVERIMKVMVGVMLICFAANLVIAGPNLLDIIRGFIPNWPEGLSLAVPRKVGGAIRDPMLLIASLLGTNFSVAAAFYQANLVRDKGWTIKQYSHGIHDAIAGIAVLCLISIVIVITTATVIPGREADNIGTLAQSLQPLLGPIAHIIFCIGLMAVTMTSFLINAMIGGGILADGIGQPAKLSDRWPRVFTVAVLLVGMAVAMLTIKKGKPVNLIIFGQALTVLGNPLMAATLLWLANRRDVMGNRRNKAAMNILGGLGLLVVVLMAIRVLWRLVLQLT